MDEVRWQGRCRLRKEYFQKIVSMGCLMKHFELYLWVGYTFLIFLIIPTVYFYLLGYSGLQAAQAIALPFLVWLILTVYLLVRWTVRKMRRRHAEPGGRERRLS